MRISNISDYLGGAETVVAQELLQGDQKNLTLRIRDAEGSAIDLTNYEVQVRTEVFQATVTNQRSSIRITSLEPVNNVNHDNYDYGTATLALPTDVLEIDNDNSNLIFRVPSTLLSDIDNTLFADADTTTPYIVAAGMRISDGATNPSIKTIRFLFVIRYNPAFHHGV